MKRRTKKQTRTKGRTTRLLLLRRKSPRASEKGTKRERRTGASGASGGDAPALRVRAKAPFCVRVASCASLIVAWRGL